MKLRFFMGAALFVLLAACGNDTSSFSVARALQGLAIPSISAGESKEQPQLQLTRAVIDSVKVPIQLVTIEARGQQALVTDIARNSGVVTWSTEDNVTISLKDGVLIATRGMAADLMAAAGPQFTERASLTRSYSIRYAHLDGEDRIISRDFECTMKRQEPQDIVILDRKYRTRHLREDCKGASLAVSNDYWIDTAGNIRKSRQWAGPQLGHLVIEDLR